MIYEINGCLCIILKEIHIFFVSMIISSIADHLINTSTQRKRNKYYSVLIQKCFLWNETSTYLKFKDRIFKGCVRYNFPTLFFKSKRALLKLGKMFFISLQKLILFSRKSNFRISDIQFSLCHEMLMHKTGNTFCWVTWEVNTVF